MKDILAHISGKSNLLLSLAYDGRRVEMKAGYIFFVIRRISCQKVHSFWPRSNNIIQQ